MGAALAALGTNTALIPRAETSKTAAPTQSQTEATPKRARGRPRKDSATPSPAKPKAKTDRKKSLDTVEYLEMDSDTPLSQLRTLTKSHKKSKEPAEDIFDPDPALTPSQRLLFKHISSAVINASPAKDASNLSWHEKILMYDPIILEDLTVWLNTGALEKAGWDGEVD